MLIRAQSDDRRAAHLGVPSPPLELAITMPDITQTYQFLLLTDQYLVQVINPTPNFIPLPDFDLRACLASQTTFSRTQCCEVVQRSGWPTVDEEGTVAFVSRHATLRCVGPTRFRGGFEEHADEFELTNDT